VLIACAFVVLLAACGGGGSSHSDSGVLPVAPANPHAPGPSATSTPSPYKTATPKPTPRQQPTPTPTPTPTPASASRNAITRLPNTNGRIGLFQTFDYYNGYMPQSTINQYGARMDAVWASLEP